MRRHLLPSFAAVAAAGSLGLFAAPALADGSSGATVPSTTTVPAQAATASPQPTTAVPAQAATVTASGAQTTTAVPAQAAPATASSPQTTTTTGTTTTTPTTPPAKPKKKKTAPTKKPKTTPAVQAKLTLSSPGSLLVHKLKAVLPGHVVKVTGSVSHFVPGQSVEVKVSLNKHVFHTGRLSIKKGAHGTGTFTATTNAKTAGILRVKATHKRNAAMTGFSQTIGISSLNTSTSYGAKSLFVDLVQMKLARLHFYIPQTGIWDSGTEWAINAYHRLLDRGTSTSLDAATLRDLMAGKGSFVVRYPKQGRHVEGNLGKQLAALINGSKVYWIFPISSGKPSTPTILGSFQVYRRTPGYLPDGMYYSDFFIRGYALHGYDPSPDYPASHGCMRLPIQDAIPAFNWLQIGDWVDVYQSTGNYTGTV
jgi:lipoprotein-anchoring transpeptidase ErfK/SrfK